MSSCLVDTSGYSAFKRGHQGLRLRLQEVSEIYLNPVIVGELRSGFLRGTRLAENLNELREFLASPRVSVLTIDEETAERYAVILHSLRSVGKLIPTNDIWIAASAMQNGTKLLTTDSHFRQVPQIVAEVFDLS